MNRAKHKEYLEGLKQILDMTNNQLDAIYAELKTESDLDLKNDVLEACGEVSTALIQKLTQMLTDKF